MKGQFMSLFMLISIVLVLVVSVYGVLFAVKKQFEGMEFGKAESSLMSIRTADSVLGKESLLMLDVCHRVAYVNAMESGKPSEYRSLFRSCIIDMNRSFSEKISALSTEYSSYHFSVNDFSVDVLDGEVAATMKYNDTINSGRAGLSLVKTAKREYNIERLAWMENTCSSRRISDVPPWARVYVDGHRAIPPISVEKGHVVEIVVEGKTGPWNENGHFVPNYAPYGRCFVKS